jgi:uncharacterized protein YeaO (DUF488 family)
MLKIYTSQYRYNGKNRLDITVKSGSQIFAPTWDMVIKFKKGLMIEEEYTKEYYKLMRKSYKNNREKWDQLLNQDEVVLVCFCKKGSFCHRYLLAEILVKLGAEYKEEI